LKKNNFLVTGGYGFIGSCLVRELLKNQDNRICNIDKLSYSSSIDSIKPNGEDNYKFKKIDIVESNKIKEVISEFEPDYIIHLAAESHVDRSIDNPDQFIKSNINGTYNLLNEGYHYWKLLPDDKKLSFRFIHVSTDEVYGSLSEKESAFLENSVYKPNSPYSASKASSDHLVYSWYKTYSFPINIVNTSNNYGPWQFPEKLIPLVISKCLKGEKIPIYGNGLQIRDWIRVEDHVNGLLTVLDKGIIGEKYNIGANCEKTNLQVVHDICSILDEVIPNKEYKYNALINFVEDRPGHDQRYAINSNKLKNLGWNPSVSWEEGIKDAINWYLNNKNFLNLENNGTYSGERLGRL